ncbi:hypothetical protein OEZ85_004212 [Tetradesmus obliquus]|uniref:Amidohydrolase 3 domain-containing protein n=1 Tax=Tetradesmus obliquus TaxID=3088 RepID=A0ABY8UK24_TETOB|nr:hypothetical protein OEZ85_004212 [Tetradesmus obliquus]
MPADHPPTGQQQQQQQRQQQQQQRRQQQQGLGPVLAGATPLPAPAAAAAAGGSSSGPQHVFVNGHIWTANPEGFVDPHVHLIFGGLSLSQINLRGASSRQEVAARVAAAAAAAADGAWLLGGGWSEADWGGGLPDASWLDEMQREWIRTQSLAGPQAYSDAVTVDKDLASGRPTGMLREHAMVAMRGIIPSPSLQERKAALAAAARYLLSRGVTAVGDMGWGVFGAAEETWTDLEEVYDAAAAAGELPIRVSSYVPLRSWQRAAQRLASNGSHHASGRLIWGGVKDFADGSLGSSTALFWRPYSDDVSGSTTGMRLIEVEELQQLVQGAAGAGLQVAIHAIGDRAVDEVLGAFEQLEECSDADQQQQQQCVQHRIEHVQHISSAVSAAKLAVLRLHAVPNPQHLISDRSMLLRKLGAERAGPGRSHAYRTLASMGVSIGFASDWPIVEVDPLASVYASVFRKAPPQAHQDKQVSAGQQGSSSSTEPQPPAPPEEQPWAPEEAMPLEVALQLHTATAATVARLDRWAGQLKAGLRGDFVVLDRSPFEGMDEDGGGGFAAGVPRVVKTYVDGRCAFGCDDGDVAGDVQAAAAAVADSR